MEQKAQAPKAQGAIEYLLIIGAAILVVAVVVIALSGIIGAGSDTTDTEAINSTYNALQCQKDCGYLDDESETCCDSYKDYCTLQGPDSAKTCQKIIPAE